MGAIKSFIFYTPEGFTEDNQHKSIENCQILGWSKGKTAQKAFENLVKENEYLIHTDFNEVIAMELANEKQDYFLLEDHKQNDKKRN